MAETTPDTEKWQAIKQENKESDEQIPEQKNHNTNRKPSTETKKKRQLEEIKTETKKVRTIKTTNKTPELQTIYLIDTTNMTTAELIQKTQIIYTKKGE